MKLHDTDTPWGVLNELCFASVLLQVPVLQSLLPLVSCVCVGGGGGGGVGGWARM